MSSPSSSDRQQANQQSGGTRRDFLKVSAAAAALLGSAPYVFGQNKAKPAAKPKPKNEPQAKYKDLRLAFVGTGGKGESALFPMADLGIQPTALCDVDARRLIRPAFRFDKAGTYSDWRRMLDRQWKDFDGVVISTPDHTHAIIALACMELGKHVYCEKPLTHNIHEVKVVMDAARRFKVNTQMGNQGHASEGNRQQVEGVRAGFVGQIKEVHMCTDRPIWPQGKNAPTDGMPAPDTLAWNLWLGPAAWRPYNAAYHPFNWRGFWDFGTGALGDMGCHIMDAPFWALDLRDPESVEATSEGKTPTMGPKSSTITYMFPERNGRPPVKVVWYDGGRKPPAELTGDIKHDNNYIVYVGEKGTLVAPYLGAPALVGDTKKEFKLAEKSIPRSPGHHQEFLDACIGGPNAGSNFDYAGPLTEMVLFGNLAIKTGQKVNWDAKTRSTGNPEFDRLLTREYRPGWEV